jgi:hypothetical protein
MRRHHGHIREPESELRRLLRTRDTGKHVDHRLTVRQCLTQWQDAVRDEVSPK